MISVIGGKFGPAVKSFMLGVFGLPGYVLPVITILLMFYFIFLATGEIPLRQKAAFAGMILCFGMLLSLFSQKFSVIPDLEEGKVKELYGMQEGGGVLFGLPALLFHSIFGNGGSIFVVILLFLLSLILFTGKGFLGKLAGLIRDLTESAERSRYERALAAEEEEESYEEEEEDPMDREALREAEMERRREERRRRLMQERRAQARKKARHEREVRARQEEKIRRKQENQRLKREAEERAEDERILRSSNRRILNRDALEPAVPSHQRLDDIHEIVINTENGHVRMEASAMTAGEIGFLPDTQEIPDVPKVQELSEIHISRGDTGIPDAYAPADAAYDPFAASAPEELYYPAEDPMPEAAYDTETYPAEDPFLPEEETQDFREQDMPSVPGQYAEDMIEEIPVVTVIRDNVRGGDEIRPILREDLHVNELPAAEVFADEPGKTFPAETDLNRPEEQPGEAVITRMEEQPAEAVITRVEEQPAAEAVIDRTEEQPVAEPFAKTAREIDLTGMPDPVTERSHRQEMGEDPISEQDALSNEPAAPAASGAENAQDSLPAQPPVRRPRYEKPPLTLLEENKKKGGGDSDQYLKETALLLQQTLKSFGVTATVTDISQGPSVTRFELQLGEGIKVSKIVNLADDLKLNLAAQDIRIEAPIPGKAAVGIEIPNKERLPVSIRELIESQEFQKAESKLTYVVGKDISGHTIVSDIAKMPHLLVAGSTGSGKSVFTNSIILSILYEANPEEVKLILIDPKVVEFSVYNGIPHLLLPVVTDPRKANAALAWAVAEMTRRYKIFAEHNVRGIKAYNDLVLEGKIPAIDGPPEKMPQIVIVVDELADLMMVASKDVEDSICRIAQLARAAGIHLIIATQRPSVDVITGLIKANMPSRVALKVSSGVDSRTILDSVGAERLLGYGDMLFYPQGYSKPLRVQGAFVSDGEVQRVTEFLKKNAAEGAIYNEEILNEISNLSGEGKAEAQGGDEEAPEDDLDSYFDDACRFVVEKEKASSGMLQRVFKVGYNRAARIVDQMEANGVVGPEEGTKPRRVLMDAGQLELFLRERHKK